jgi:organic hydroperoxide reductase OsmC/OhrA
MELLHKIAAVLVTLLLYFVIAILQTPRTARAADEVPHLHHAAHDQCFIAHSVKTEIVVDGSH